ncbi:MAG TPA: cytidylate kinase-like family protein [Myxococcota bacterium]|nr:cytidylate kinase-like family protein [Myxococcota bacterium]HRY97128.1 cytidylate kinase-like family protein [Myxococcota bacterium]HSA21205.1 cytidylate kinase-like family protein [Myxococcota bacterium]
MPRITLASYLGLPGSDPTVPRTQPGPFVTISRQYGCGGYLVGQILVELLNEKEKNSFQGWRIYNKFILNQLATETELAVELLERERRSKPSVVLDFFRSLAGERIPPGVEIRRQITILMRGLAVYGRAVFVGQGGVHATDDIPRGLSVRLEAPRGWRVREIASQQGVDESRAGAIIEEKELEREYLRKLYTRQSPREVPFQLTYDCSAFSTQQIAEHLVQALEIRGLVRG